jgi:hypothetical protein
MKEVVIEKWLKKLPKNIIGKMPFNGQKRPWQF